MYYVKLLLKEYASKYPLACNLTDDEYFDIIEDYIIQELDSLNEGGRKYEIKTSSGDYTIGKRDIKKILSYINTFIEMGRVYIVSRGKHSIYISIIWRAMF